jgi:Fe2+ or Zn2+ uptake regulation protein
VLKRSIVADLRAKELRVTPVRVAVLATLSERDTPVSVPELLRSLKHERPNKTTLYRELERLVAAGLVRQVHLGERQMRYEPADRPHHHHIVCVDCGKTDDVFVDQDIERHTRAVSRSTRFKVLDHTLEFSGLCAACNVPA